MNRRGLASLVVSLASPLVLVVSCSSSSGSGCREISASTKAALGIPSGSSVKSGDKLGNGRTVSYIAGPGGALWVTDGDPSKDLGGLTLPINAEARTASPVGADAADATAPIFGTVSVTSKDAAKAKGCEG